MQLPQFLLQLLRAPLGGTCRACGVVQLRRERARLLGLGLPLPLQLLRGCAVLLVQLTEFRVLADLCDARVAQ
jgi:hypothetical protein